MKSLIDEGHRFVMIENSSVSGLLTRYIHPNHQSSCTLETDDNGDVITYEEYHPFGTTSYQATNASITAAAKRYRYTGMERDDETGLNYHNARYYINWLGRWLNPDPIGIGDGINVYAYCKNNPVKNMDKEGTQAGEGDDKKKVEQDAVDAAKANKQFAPRDKTSVAKNPAPDIKNPSEMTVNLPEVEVTASRLPTKNRANAKSEKLSPFVRKQLDNIIETEKGYVNNPKDPGGKTKYGIAEKREWLDAAKFLGIDPNPDNIQNLTQEQAEKYYIHSRFEKFRITDIKNEKVANAFFDQSVLTPGIINKNMKIALNSLGYDFDVNSKKLSDDQIKAINNTNPDDLVNAFVAKQLEHYEAIKYTNPSNYNEHIKGWTNRLERLKNYKP